MLIVYFENMFDLFDNQRYIEVKECYVLVFKSHYWIAMSFYYV